MAQLITDKKLRWAQGVIRQIAPKMDEELFMDIIVELAETYEGITPSGKAQSLEIEITDLQAVALAAALSSVWEIKQHARR